MTVLDYILCPLCGNALCRHDRSLLCEKGHTYDIAKAGYVNLLPPGKEKNARTGDEKAMVKARVDFLAKDYYAPISRQVATLVAEAFPGEKTLSFADMGCGEGYHTCRIAETLSSLGTEQVMALGFDASKCAAEYASKQAKAKNLMPRDGVGAEHQSDVQAYFFPANIFHLPLKEHRMDAAVSMFAPVAGEEASRILKKGGKLIVVASGRHHLLQLRQLIYDEVRLADALPPDIEGFALIDQRNLTYKTAIKSRDDIASLFVMTPFYYKTTEEGRNRLLAKDSLELTVDVNYFVYEVQ